MNLLVASNFERKTDSGAAGTLLAISDAWKSSGHSVEHLWRDSPPVSRIIDESVRVPVNQLREIQNHLRRYPETDVVVVSQPYSYRAFEVLKPRYPQTLFVNRTHGWEARWIESQNRFGWDPPAGRSSRLLRTVAQVVRKHMCRRCAQAAHGVVAACRDDAEWIREHYRLPPWQVTAIPYGVELADLPLAPIRTAAGPVRLIYAGQYCQRKGSKVLETVLPHMATEFPSARLTFVVSDESIRDVESTYRPTWGQRLVVHSWKYRHDLYRLFGEHDVLLMPSFFEGFGKVVVEAMSMGCVVIGFTEGGTADLASPACLTCPRGDTDAFASLVRAALAGRFDFNALSLVAVSAARERTWRDTAVETIGFFCQLAHRQGVKFRGY